MKTTKTKAILKSICTISFIVMMPCLAWAQTTRQKININPVWRFELGDPEGASDLKFDDSQWDVVSLPHTHEIFNADLKGFGEHGRNIGWYRREIQVPDDWQGKNIFLEFQGVMQTTSLWVNGKYVGEHAVSGYDSFHFDITSYIHPGKNLIAVRVDNTVNPDCPPDFLWADFMLFGGIYRDVFLVVTDPVHITFPWEAKQAGIRLTLPEISEKQAVVKAETTVRNQSGKPSLCTVTTEILDRQGKAAASMNSKQEIPAGGEYTFEQTSSPIANPELWSPDNPYLYRVQTTVKDGGRELDLIQTNLGMRWFKFDKEQGFFLNGKHLKLIGVNRHQTWPFIGNAVPNGLHRADAEQIKSMGVNWVRLSHYPHDPDFIDALDELGLMALEEGPTWMNEGNAKWMDNLETAFRSMIRRDRNHPCIIIWNACINHANGHPRLVKAANEEDPARPRGQSDVPCPMDFNHKNISGNSALTIEHTGHTFPATRGDRKESLQKKLNNWEDPSVTYNREYHQARRHWENTDAAYKVPGNSGLAVWCMYDYNTFHNSLEGIARHGVFDLFRIPKFSYWWHVSELTKEPMVYIVRVDPAKAAVFSNCQQVRLSENTGDGYKEVATQKPDAGFALNHPPFHFAVGKKAVGLKAEGLIDGKTAAAYEWKQYGAPAALTLETDRPEITADGGDISRVVVTAVDENGTAVDNSDLPVTFSIKGMGQIVSDNPIKLRAGKIIALVQSGFVPDHLTLSASAPGIKSAQITLNTLPAPAGVDMPKNLTVKQPTRSNRIVLPPKTNVQEQPWLAFKSKTDVPKDSWIESDPIMVPGKVKEASIEIRGGEYRIYTGEWTDKPGKAIAGDAVYVRVKSSPSANTGAWAELVIGNMRTRFEVKTSQEQRRERNRQ
jgi:beta-galactosidase